MKTSLQTVVGRGSLQGLDSPDAKEREKAAALLSQLFSSHDEVANHRSAVCLNTVPRVAIFLGHRVRPVPPYSNILPSGKMVH